MIKNQKQIGSFLLGLSLLVSSTGFSATAARAVGSGMVYPTLNFALHQNPAGLAESPSASLSGLYDIDGSNIYGSATIGQNGFGAGFDYTRLDATSSSTEAFGFGAKLSSMMIGAGFYTTEFANMGVDMGAAFELKGLRVAATVSGLTDGLTAIGAGVGVSMGMWGAEISAGKSLVDGAPNTLALNAGLHATIKMLSLGVGYSAISDDIGGGDIWGGLSFAVNRRISVEGFYNGGGTALQLGDFSVGARVQF
jgi:hypothetical protein